MMTKNSPARRSTPICTTVLAFACTFIMAACSQSESPVTQIAPDQPRVTGAPEVGRIKAKGGTKIAVLVNKQPITSNQIQRRMAFVRLRRMKGNSRQIATNELIDEAIKLQEARRLRAVASPAEVNQAYAGFAKNNRMTVSTLDRMLAQSGVTKRGFKDYVRASISWQRVVGSRVQSGSSARGVPNTQKWLPAVGTQSTKSNEYTIQQIVFIVPQSKRGALLAKRRTEANRFRTQLNGCENTRQLAAGLKDVTILDRGRLLEAELPPRWAKEIKATPAGKVTRIRDDSKGVEMIAVCKTREVIGSPTGIDASILSSGEGRKKAQEVGKEYLAKLKARAVIQRR